MVIGSRLCSGPRNDDLLKMQSCPQPVMTTTVVTAVVATAADREGPALCLGSAQGFADTVSTPHNNPVFQMRRVRFRGRWSSSLRTKISIAFSDSRTPISIIIWGLSWLDVVTQSSISDQTFQTENSKSNSPHWIIFIKHLVCARRHAGPWRDDSGQASTAPALMAPTVPSVEIICLRPQVRSDVGGRLKSTWHIAGAQ